MAEGPGRGRLLGILVADGFALVALHAAGRLRALAMDWHDPRAWLATTPPEDAVAAVLRVAGLALGYWLLVTTVAYVLSCAAGRETLAAAIGRLTVPGTRSVADRAVALALATGALALPALPASGQEQGQEQGPPADERLVVREGDVLVPPGLAPPARPSAPEPPDRGADERRATDNSVPRGASAASHVVEAGDTLWDIAAARVTARTGDQASERDIARYWLHVVADNRSRLVSGDPDLIFPGEEILLPDGDPGGVDGQAGAGGGDS